MKTGWMEIQKKKGTRDMMSGRTNEEEQNKHGRERRWKERSKMDG